MFFLFFWYALFEGKVSQYTDEKKRASLIVYKLGK